MVIRVPVLLTYNNKGTKQATKDVKNFGNDITKTFKKMGLASKLSVAAITTGLTLLAKKSAQAAMAEEKQAKALAQTLNNLGKSYETSKVLDFANSLQFATGVSEDQLRPALQRLLTTTNSVAKSQDLLKLALNISAGTGKDLQAVVAALSRAYLGNNAALSRLGTNLTKAELKVASFDQITNKLARTYANQASQAAQTFSGKLSILGVAADEAREKFGQGLIATLEELAGPQGFEGLAGSINTTADAFNGLLEVSQKGGVLKQFIDANKELLGMSAGNKIFQQLAKIGAQADIARNSGTPAVQSQLAIQRQQISDAKVQLELQKKIRLEEQKKALLAKQAASAKRLAAKFDQEAIAIEAALKGKLSDEDRARLLALKALKSESAADDQKALDDLNAAQKKSAAEELARIAERSAASSAAIAKQKSEYQALTEWLKSNPINVYTEFTNSAGQVVTAPGSFGVPGTNVSTGGNFPTNVAPMAPVTGGGAVASATPNVTVNVNAGTIADENKLTYIISNELTKFVRFGGITAPAGFI